MPEALQPTAVSINVVVYDAPPGYNPWIWYDGRYMYRPYPYHRYYREHYRR